MDINREAQITLTRLLPRLQPILRASPDQDWFVARLRQQFPRLFRLLLELYGTHYDFYYHLEQMLVTAAQAYVERSDDLHQLDAQREADPTWFKSERMVGAVLYVDLFNDTLAGLREKIDYLKELKITYLHLMPLFRAPAENSDGGYAVSDYREIEPKLGTMADLRQLAAELRGDGISLVVDFVFNHTSDEHDWALQALDSDPIHQGYYHIFPDRTLPDQYAPHLREIFPEQAPGSFSYRGEIDSWVWTTFNTFQWDLNYRNPATFTAMLGEMLFLANVGVEVLRLDAVAFIWKQLGTPSENLPQAHTIIQAYNALTKIVCPAMLFKSEAIVHPDDVTGYISTDESPISYNPTFMALLWEALATREVKLLRDSMSHRFDLPEGCTWVNYIRVHDDIGWSFADEDATWLGINGFDHRQFLNRFYTGDFPGSFASGLGFNFNPVTLDMRICGTAASLAGLEQAANRDDAVLIDHAVRRIILLHAVILSAGGIPLLYIGDEIATLNDYSFRNDPSRAGDERWVHRPKFDWSRAELRHDPSTPQGRVFTALKRLIVMRTSTPALADRHTLFIDTQDPHVLGFVRNGAVLVLANFSEHTRSLRRDVLAAYWAIADRVVDLTTGEPFDLTAMFALEPYQVVWLAAASDA